MHLLRLSSSLTGANTSSIDKYIEDFANIGINITFILVTQGKFIDNNSDYSLLEKYGSNIDRIICYIKPETISH